jgi:citrate lyase subunit beta/citryl-CoA lyase
MSAENLRRSWLIVPASKPVEDAARSGADVLVLDLAEFVAEKDKPAARSGVRSAIAALSEHGGEVFVQIDSGAAEADLAACVWPGLSGVVVSRAETAQRTAQISGLIDALEKERGLANRAIGIIPALETALGNHEAYEIVTSSDRVRGVTLGRADLVMDLRPEPSGEIHLMPYLMQRLVIVAGAAGVTPIGAWWRAPDRGLLATAADTFEAARRGRAIGYKGAMCVDPWQVEPLNRAYARTAGTAAHA